MAVIIIAQNAKLVAIKSFENKCAKFGAVGGWHGWGLFYLISNKMTHG